MRVEDGFSIGKSLARWLGVTENARSTLRVGSVDRSAIKDGSRS